MVYTPKKDEIMTVRLPGEALRATVTRVVTPDRVKVRIDQIQPRVQTHGYGLGDTATCDRVKTHFGEEWVAPRNG